MEELGIIFHYHKADKLTRQHLDFIKKSNPNIPIACLSNEEFLPGENNFNLLEAEYCDSIYANLIAGNHRSYSWEILDLAIFAYYKQRNIQAKKWACIEYDVLCYDMSIKEFFGDYYNSEFVICGVNKVPKDSWYHKAKFGHLPEKYKKYAVGCYPEAVMLISDELLNNIVLELENNYFNCYCEIRLPTLAAYLGKPHISYTTYPGKIWYTPVELPKPIKPGFYHAIKECI